MGCETSLTECTSTLFRPIVVTKNGAEEPDARFGQRILNAIHDQRHDVERIRDILPNSPYEGLEFREKLKELDRLGSEIHKAQQQCSLLHQYATQKAEHHRLSEDLSRRQVQAERAEKEKRRKEHQLRRKRLRMQVLQEQTTERQLRREETSRRRYHREPEGVDQERLLPSPPQGGGMIRRIRDVEIPDLQVDIEALEKDIRELDQTVEEFRRTRDRVHDLNAYLTRTIPPDLDENRIENLRQRLRQIRATLIERNPRMFNFLLEDTPEDYGRHEKDFDEFYELIESGCCPCGSPFSAHSVLLTPYMEESDKLEELLLDFVEDNNADTTSMRSAQQQFPGEVDPCIPKQQTEICVNPGTVVYGIEDAARQLSKQHEKRSDDPVDILAIVSDRFDVAWAKGKQCFRIVDYSGSAFVTVKNVDNEPVKIGDIVRFNRVRLDRNHRDFPKRTVLDSLTSEHFPHFCHKWNDLDAGPAWMCLGHVSHLDGSVIQKRSAQLIPESMVTDEGQISSLVEWYLHSDEFKARSPLLSQIPHRRRSIEELISCVGSTGDIVAKVEQVVDPPFKSASTSLQKRKRRTALSPMGFAILSETKRPSCSKYHATLLDPEKKFFTSLRDANDFDCAVLICGVVSMRANQVESRPSTLNVEDVILVLTKESRLTLLSSSTASVNDNNDDDDDRDWQDRGDTSTLVETTTPLSLTGTQATVVDGPQSIQFEAYIVEILVEEDMSYSNNVLKLAQSQNDAHTMTAIFDLLWDDSPARPTTMRLRLALTSGAQMNVRASQLILCQLCGGKNVLALSSHNESNDLLRSKAKVLFESLFQQKTPLLWEVNRNGSGDWDVTKVTLHRL